MKNCSGGDKMRNPSGHQGENERQQKKKVNEKKNTYDIPSIKRVTWKFYVTKQRQRNVQKKGAARAKMCFC